MNDAAVTEIVGRILTREGGVVSLPGEGWVTRWGQTPPWLEHYGLPLPMTKADAGANYLAWLRKSGLIAVCDQADALADLTVDYAVLHGVHRAVLALQAGLGVPADGVMGPVTLAALAQADRASLARKVLADRMRATGRLITDRPAQYAQFAAGWLNRLASLTEAL